MESPNKRLNIFLYVFEGVGAIFTAFFLVAYLAGLPTTNVLHSEPVFRISLSVLGVVLLALILVGVIAAAAVKRR